MSTASVVPLAASHRERSGLHRYRREISVAAAYAFLLLVLALIKPAGRPSFFQSQFADTFISAAPLLVAAAGMTLVILAREIDISIGSQFSVAGVVAGLLLAAKMPAAIAVLGTLAAGALMGAINGALIGWMRLPSIVVTLATMVILRGGLLWASQGAAVRLPPAFQWFGASQQSGEWIIILVALLIFAVLSWGMRSIAAGRAVYAVGSDAEAARLAGIRPQRVVFSVFVLMGVLTAIAALLNDVRFTIVYPNYGDGLELKVIAAVVVGGTAISGGRGTLAGTLIGVLLLATIAPALVFLGAPPQWEKALQGLIILAAVASDGLGRRRG